MATHDRILESKIFFQNKLDNNMDLDKTTMDIDRLKFKPNKVCGICGDKALGYNFNAITCEACKAFFRRNALRSKDFKCPFDGNCKIDLVTRRFCQKCRLKKCFDIGMKKEWILSEEEKKVKREKIMENRKKKDSNHNLNGGGPGIHLYSQLSNISDNNTSSSSANSHPDLNKSNDCLTTPTTTIDDDDFMAMAAATTTNNNCPTLASSMAENAASNSCYTDDDHHPHPPPPHHHHHHAHHHHHHHHLHHHSHNNNDNCDKEFMNSIHLLKHHQHRNYTVNGDIYLPTSKFFPIKESSSSSTTDECSPSPPAIPLSLCQPKSNHPPSNSSIKPTLLYNKLHNHHNHHNNDNHDLHSSSNSNSNSLLNSSLSLKTINSDNDGDLNRSLPSSKAHHNHNNNNNYHYPPNHNWFENDGGGNGSDPNTTDNLNHYLESKSLNLNMIKQVSNSHNHHHHHPHNHHHKEASSSSSSSSPSLSQYPLIPKHFFKTEPVQEEIMVSAPRHQHHSYHHPNEFGPTTHQHPLHSQTHHILGLPPSSMLAGHRRMNNTSANNRITTCDISSGISSDESETTTVYGAYDGDRRPYPDDLYLLHRSVSFANASNDQIESIMEHPSQSIGGLINVEDESSFDKMNLVDNHHQPVNNQTTFDGGGGGGLGDDVEQINDKQHLQQLLQSQSQQPQPENSISIIQQDLAAVPNGPQSNGYNSVEIIRMEELTYACGHLQDWYHHGPLLDEILHLTEIYQVAEQVIHHLISMAKMINSFCELCETDQISLLKYSVTEMIILRSVPCFLSNKDAWIFNLKRNEKGTILKFKTCQSQIPSTEFSDDIKHFMMAIPDTCKNDQSLFDLVTMVILFNPNRLELKHKEVVRLEYMTYCHLLSKHISANYSSSSATTASSKSNRIHLETILNLIDRLHKINDKIKHRLPFRIIEAYRTKLAHLPTYLEEDHHHHEPANDSERERGS